MRDFKLGLVAATVVGPMFAGVSPTYAAVTISLTNVSVPPGTVAEVGVYASSDTLDPISGFNFPLDLNGDGYNPILPSGFTLDAVPLRNALFSNLAFNTTSAVVPLIGVDGIVNSSGDVDVTLNTTPTLLFSLVVNVAPDAVVGSVLPLEIELPPEPFSALFNVAGPGRPGGPPVSSPTVLTSAYGSITVMPEPSVATVLVAGAMAVRRRRSPIG